MVVTNLQTFSGEVEIPDGNLQLKKILELSANNSSTSNTGILISRNLGATSNSNVIVYFDEATESLRVGHTLNAASHSELIMDTANTLVMNVFGDVEASFFKGDGGLLSNLVTDLQSVTENGADTDQTLILTNALTGIDVRTGNVIVAGNVTAGILFGDGGLLSNITQTLQGITEIGNTTNLTLQFNNVTTAFVTEANVGIANANPNYNLSVGSNIHVHDTGINGNVLSLTGNMHVSHKITLGSVEILPGYGLENVTNISNLAHSTLRFNNTTTAFVTTAMAGVGIEPDSSDVGVAGLHVDGHLRLGGPAGTDENSDIYLRSAGQLNIESNDTDTDNQYTALAMRAGNLNESNIIIEGALSDETKQYISFATRNAERMKIDRQGNVMIGHDATLHKLDVAGTANVTTMHAANLVINTVSVSVIYDLDATLENGNTTSNSMTVGGIEISGASGELFRYTDGTRTVYGGCDGNEPWFGTFSDDNLRLVTNGTERVRLSNVGQVGIGTYAPEYTLDVRGGSVNYKERWLTDMVLPAGQTRKPVSNVITNSSALTAGNWYRVALNGSATDGSSGGSRASARFTITDGQPSYHAQRSFYAGNSFGGYPFIHLLYNTGYSSLGSISQVRIVEDGDYEGIAIDIYAVQNTPIGGVHVIIDDNYATEGFALQPFTSVAADISGMNEMVLNLNETSWSIFNNSNTYNMCMDFAGNVGIGTRNPTRSLHIYRGQSYVSGGTSNNSAFEIFQQLGTNDYIYTGQHKAQFRIKNGLGNFGNRSLELALLDNGTGVIQANGANEGYFPLLMNPAGGDVGINTNIPLAKFTIWSNYYGGQNDGFCIDAYDGSTAYNLRLHPFVQASGAVGYNFRVNNNASSHDYGLVIGYNGYIGMGLSTTGYAPLTVASTRTADTWSTGSSILSVLHDNGAGAFYGMSFAVSGTAGDGVIQTYNADTGSALYNLRLQPSGGNVGIGTITPQQKLHVHLGAGVTWADFSVRATSLWGDGLSVASEYGGTLYATLYGAMFQNLHITPSSAGANASIRIGRAGGVATGNYWEVACRTDGHYHIANNSVATIFSGGAIFFVGGGQNIRTVRVKALRDGTYDYTTGSTGATVSVRVPYDHNTGETLWDDTNERFTAPFTGEYVISGSFMATPSNSNYIWTQLYHYNSSGTILSYGDQMGMFDPKPSTYNTVHFYTTLDMGAGDYFEVIYFARAFSGTACAVNLHGNWGQINIHCLRRY